MYTEDLSKFTKKFIQVHRDNKASVRLALNIIGHAGNGKTELVEALGTELDMAVVAPRAGELEGGEFTGIPRDHIEDGALVMKYALPGFLPHYKLDKDGNIETFIDDEGMERKRINIKLLGAAIKNRKQLEKKHGEGWENKVKGVVIFLDEVNRAQDDATKMSIFQLPEKYAIHTYSVPENCVVMSAMNPSTDEYQVNEMDAERAFMDRMIHIKLESKVDDWLIWAERNGVDEAITSFINADASALQDGSLSSFDLDIPITPRSWGKTVNALLKDIDLRSFEDGIIREVLAGVVGNIFANNFVNHMKENLNKVVTGEEIITKYDKVRKNITKAVKGNRMDYLDQVIRNVMVVCSDEQNVEKYDFEGNLENFEKFIEDLPAELRMTFVNQVINYEHVNEILGVSSVIYDVLSKDQKRAHKE